MDRRRFVFSALAATAAVRAVAQSPGTPPHTSLTWHPDRPGPVVPENFVGLSYETQQLSDPSALAPTNTGLIAALRELSPRGVLRLGGNTSDYGYWKPTPTSVAPPREKRPYKVGDPPPDLSYAVTPEAVHNLKGFLDATGWTCLYGINMGTNTTALAAEEAAYVHQVLGDKLEYFQVGNEADRFGSTIRDPKTWSADTFLDEWLTFAHAILERVPKAKFGMPDIASNAKWFQTIGDRLASNGIRRQISCLTHHYYIGGPPSNPDMTVNRILQRDPRVVKDADLVTTAAEKLGTRWRMTEGNTCYRGGKPGVSDVWAAGLWSADYLLELASLGYAGANLHGGEARFVANSLGGKLPGDELVSGDPALHPRPYYTPIAHIGDRFVPEPVSFGMRIAQRFAGATLLPVDIETGGVNTTAYAAQRRDGTHLLVIINKDLQQPFTVRLPAAPTAVETMSAAMIDSTQVNVAHPKPQPGAVQTVGPYTISLFTLPG